MKKQEIKANKKKYKMQICTLFNLGFDLIDVLTFVIFFIFMLNPFIFLFIIHIISNFRIKVNTAKLE